MTLPSSRATHFRPRASASTGCWCAPSESRRPTATASASTSSTATSSLRGLGMDEERRRKNRRGAEPRHLLRGHHPLSTCCSTSRAATTQRGPATSSPSPTGSSGSSASTTSARHYVAGRREGVIKEDELDVGQEYSNSYEQTKMEAEALVREFGERHPVAIHRPSIVVGDSRTGETASFQGFYQALLFYRQLYKKWRVLVHVLKFVGRADRELDRRSWCPIDYVADSALLRLDGRRPRAWGKVFPPHLGARLHRRRSTSYANHRAVHWRASRRCWASPRTWSMAWRLDLCTWGRLGQAAEPMLKAGQGLPDGRPAFSMFDKVKHRTHSPQGTGIKTPHPGDYFKPRAPGEGPRSGGRCRRVLVPWSGSLPSACLLHVLCSKEALAAGWRRGRRHERQAQLWPVLRLRLWPHCSAYTPAASGRDSRAQVGSCGSLSGTFGCRGPFGREEQS